MLFGSLAREVCFAWRVDRCDVLRAFDEQVRRCTERDVPEEVVELDDQVLRRLAPRGLWSGIVWSQLDERNADAVIAAQVERFAQQGRAWEWKHYSYDSPADLPQRLLAHGFSAEAPEALLFAELGELELDRSPPTGLEVAAVRDARGVKDMVAVHDAVFGGDNSGLNNTLLAALERTPPTAAGFVAMADGAPVAAGRVEFQPGGEFASLWGGATMPAWRKRGAFRALVAHRAAAARERGVRYLQVDAMPSSQPILESVGFVRLATTTPYMHTGSPS